MSRKKIDTGKKSLMISSCYVELYLDSWWYEIAEEHYLYKAPTKDNEGVVFRMIMDAGKMSCYRVSLKTIRDNILDSVEDYKIIYKITSTYASEVPFHNISLCAKSSD